MTYTLYYAGFGTGEPNAVMATNSDGSGFSFLFDPANTDYQAYLAWVEAGGVPLPAEVTV